MKKTVYVLITMLLLLCLSNTTSETIYASTIECPDCNGNGSVKCTICNGTGEMGEICQNCEGRGYLEGHSFEDDEECQVCQGRGFFYCSNCDGYGSVTCEKCGGVILPHTKHTAQEIAEKSKKQFGKQLCWDCAKEARAAVK